MLSYKPVCEFSNKILNFATNLQTLQQSSESYSDKLAEIDCKLNRLKLTVTFLVYKTLTISFWKSSLIKTSKMVERKWYWTLTCGDRAGSVPVGRYTVEFHSASIPYAIIMITA